MVTKFLAKIIIYIWFSTSINSLDYFEKKWVLYITLKKKSLQKSKAVSSNFCDTKSKINLMKLLFASKYITIIC